MVDLIPLQLNFFETKNKIMAQKHFLTAETEKKRLFNLQSLRPPASAVYFLLTDKDFFNDLLLPQTRHRYRDIIKTRSGTHSTFATIGRSCRYSS